MVSRGDTRDVGADGLDDASALVAEHRRTHRLRRSVDRVPVRVTDAAGRQPDEDFLASWGSEVELGDRQWPTRLLENCAPDTHQRRPGAKGSSSGAMRPSSTSGASRAAVAGASVTPSIPCPDGDEEVVVPGQRSDQRKAVRGRRTQSGPGRRAARPRFGSPAGEIGARCGEQALAGAGGRLRTRCAELEHAGEAHAVLVGAQPELRLGQVERVTGRRAISCNRDAIASRGLDRDANAEASEEPRPTGAPRPPRPSRRAQVAVVGRDRPAVRSRRRRSATSRSRGSAPLPPEVARPDRP